jgi:hypothetical protein
MARVRQKACERCGVVSGVLYRIQSEQSGVWCLCCSECRRMAEAQPHYRYGGTWKAVKRH